MNNKQYKMGLPETITIVIALCYNQQIFRVILIGSLYSSNERSSWITFTIYSTLRFFYSLVRLFN